MALPAHLMPAPTLVTIYRYENHSIFGWFNQLWVCEDTGLVMYVGIRGHTEWHGNFHLLDFNMASLTFHHHGEEHRLKHAVLCRWRHGWRGVDYANRQITLTRLTQLQYNHATGLWGNP